MLTQSRQASHQIALIKPIRGAEELIEHALQLFDSMLWVFRGTTRAHWSLSSPSEADVVVVHHAEPAEHIERWRAQGKVIVMLRTEDSSQLADDHTLIYPFPASQVMSLLERLDAELDTSGSMIAPPVSCTSEPLPSAHTWSLVESIRTLRTVRNPDIWLAIQTTQQPLLWLRGDAARYQSSATTQQAIRRGSLPLDGLVLERSSPPRLGLISGRGYELTWFAAYHTSDTLAPWLSESVAYRLKRWPDLGVVRPADAALLSRQLKVVAALDSAPASMAELCQRAGVADDEVIRTLNALSACELIEPATASNADTATPFQIERPKMGFRQLFDSIRKHLRFGSAT